MRLTPRATRFFDLLSDAARNLVTATALLRQLLAAEPGARPQIVEKLRDVEHDGDRLVHEIMVQLNRSFITPFDREDIQALASRIDDVLDALYTAGDLVVLYRVDELPGGVSGLIDVLCSAAELTAAAMPGLAKVGELEPFWVEINELENAADDRYRQLLARLFEPGADPLTVLKTKEVIDQLETAADAFEHVADVVQTIAVKES
jgi:predicted phosphate transport protein (TIGR00153 family)